MKWLLSNCGSTATAIMPRSPSEQTRARMSSAGVAFRAPFSYTRTTPASSAISRRPPGTKASDVGWFAFATNES